MPAPLPMVERLNLPAAVAAPFKPHSLHEDWEYQDAVLDQKLAAKGCRGVTHGYSRSEVERSRALVIGCNYPRSKQLRLWGAVADARSWAAALTARLGVSSKGVSLLVDETSDGTPMDESDSQFPSQRRILDHCTKLTQGAQAGDLIVLVFCGRGTLVLNNSEEHDKEEEQEGDETKQAEEGLLCADCDAADWIRGYSLRMITAGMLAHFWEDLPRGLVLNLIIDSEHGCSMLPVSRRLDAARIPASVNLNVEPFPLMEVLAVGVTCSQVAAKAAIAHATSADPEAERYYGRRGGKDALPHRRWLRGQLLWDTTAGQNEPFSMHNEVQAFAFMATCPLGEAFEAHMDRRSSGKVRGPSGRRGVLTHCILRALEEMNFQGTYYAVWWNAIRIARQAKVGHQFFQLVFSDGADPTLREAFEPVSDAEARAYARRTILEQLPEDSERVHFCSRCTTGHVPQQGLGENPPLSARGAISCGCGPSHAECMVM